MSFYHRRYLRYNLKITISKQVWKNSVNKMNDWKGECTTCKTKIEHKRKSIVNSKSNEFEEFIKIKFSFLQTDESTVLDTDGQPKDDFKMLNQLEPIPLTPKLKKEVQHPISLVKPH